ncbi:hypothetical protein LMG28614_06890 [Paraburkholderia ultramafica]|uniref:Uncharacterized protein n=1 Tax=Paraburkholderia ultramafica TaxID=1544867 RepID=A0A6S7BQ17_9BURK|nr:hypothetical protein [Paraburkholderia ultramafica]CAB3808820.1 hypothetical protein LMG28614_06890 [Paraburkholderia ultramafica]
MAGDHDIPLGAHPVAEKRRRGRPRKPDTLTNAQRQAAFRARQKAADKSVTVTKNEHDELVRECERLRKELAKAREIAKPRVRMSSVGEPAASAVLVQQVPADEAESDDKRLLVTMNGREFFSLQRLEAHYGLPKRAVLERLIWWADRSVVQSFEHDDAAFHRYLNRITKNR